MLRSPITHCFSLSLSLCRSVRLCRRRNSAELNKLRSEYSGLMKELTETNGKLQQEEHQRKGLEVGYKQNVSQLEVRSATQTATHAHTQNGRPQALF